LYFQIFVSSDAFDNSALFYKQLEFIWLIGVRGVAVKAGCKIDAPGSATQSRFTTPWLGNVFWPIRLLRPFGSDVQLFQTFGSGNQLFQPFGSGNQLFQPFGSAISFSFLFRGSETDWIDRKAPYR
jgi:hypothetical protein